MGHVRQARPADHLRLRAIQETTLAEYSPELLDTAVHGSLGLLVAEELEPVGYSLFLPGDDVAVLLELAVVPAWQGEGIGSVLLEETCSQLTEAEHDTVRVTARTSDDRARQFYERRGFEHVKLLPGYFESGDGVLLSRQL